MFGMAIMVWLDEEQNETAFDDCFMVKLSIKRCISNDSSCLQHALVHPCIARLRPSMAADGCSSGLPKLMRLLIFYLGVDSYNKRNSQIVGIARTRAVP